jgi:hypothetical protein
MGDTHAHAHKLAVKKSPVVQSVLTSAGASCRNERREQENNINHTKYQHKVANIYVTNC